jgi:hypothetical protein
MNSGRSLLKVNMPQKNYEEFLYKNIEELESKYSELVKKSCFYEKNYKTIEENCKQNKQIIDEKTKIISELEIYIKEVEKINLGLKKEFDTLRFYSQNHFSMFTLKFSKEEIDLGLINTLKGRIEDYETKN